jgi:glycosyltransferase involved in cell wall biosynthesis
MAERLAIAYVASRYPKLTETFVFREVAELERQGHAVLCIAFTAGDGADVHADAGAAAGQVLLPTAATLAAAQLYWLRRRPRVYARLAGECLAGAARSPRTLVRTLAAVPVGALVGRIVVERRIGHVHAHWATHPTTAALVASALADVPFSLTAHAHDIQVDTTLLAWKLRRAAFAVTVSDYNRRRLVGLAPAARIEVVPCGIDTCAFAPRPEPARDGAFRVACVGRLDPQKGQEHLLRALALLQAQGRPVHCALVGGGRERARLERLAATLRLADVVFHGPLPSNGVRRVLGGAHVMVLPSVTLRSGRTEGQPVALKEAMAMGVPVVASRVTGVPELVRDGETGLLVEPGSPAQIAAAVARLMDDAALARRLAVAGRVLVGDEHDSRRSATRLAALFAGAAGAA